MILEKKDIIKKVFYEICDKLDYARMSPLQIKQELSKFIDKHIGKLTKENSDVTTELSDMYLDHFWSNKEYEIQDEFTYNDFI